MQRIYKKINKAKAKTKHNVKAVWAQMAQKYTKHTIIFLILILLHIQYLWQIFQFTYIYLL